MYWESVRQGGGTPTLESFLDVEKMEAFLGFMKVHTSHSIHGAIAGGASELLAEHVIKATYSLHHQNQGHLQDSTMGTYVHNFRYVVNYVASRDEHLGQELPMASFLTSMGARYRKQSQRAESEKSWQAMASKRQWIHWYVFQHPPH